MVSRFNVVARNVLGWRPPTLVSLLSFAIGIAVFATLTVPVLVTVDGILYVANAKSILTPDFARAYTMYREPVYPLFLKTLHFFGDAGNLIVFSQGLLLSTAVFLALLSLHRVLRWGRLTFAEMLVAALLMINPMFLDYAGTVLQQALFTFQLALFGFLLSYALVPSRRIQPWLVFTFQMCAYFLAIWTSIGWIYLGLIPVALTSALIIRAFIAKRFPLDSRRGLRKRISSVLISTIVLALSLVATYFVGHQVFNVWERIKAPYVAASTEKGYVIQPISSVPYIPTVVEMTTRTLSLMNMVVIEPYERENDLFMSIQMRRQSPSSIWDTAFEAEPYASYSVNYFLMTNPGELLHNGYARLKNIAPIGFQVTFAALWVSWLIFLIRRNWKSFVLLMAIPINFLLVYAASNSPIDRYGIPAFSFAIACLALSPLGLLRLKQSAAPGNETSGSDVISIARR